MGGQDSTIKYKQDGKGDRVLLAANGSRGWHRLLRYERTRKRSPRQRSEAKPVGDQVAADVDGETLAERPLMKRKVEACRRPGSNRRRWRDAVCGYEEPTTMKEDIGAGEVGSRRRPKCRGEVEGATTDGEEGGEFVDRVQWRGCASG
ncbi:hypothetical protein B296_00013003 [Ensete ventricosum]|uniref:Uncharacterized protein n=1 Tax=Ensete ventricosum TaxID=4639 RepID=A0A426ZVB1_ENSVE|nr:hypothetical protein B296_00013003 [Ensete ventricosum]